MNKTTMAMAAAVLTAFGLRAELPLAKMQTNEKFLRATGGMLEQAAAGTIAFVNCQEKVPLSNVEERVAYFGKIVRFEGKVVSGAFNLKTAAVPQDATAAMFIVDDPALPMSLIAPEAKWGVLNVHPLKTDIQFRREFNRVAIMTFGGSVSQFKNALMQTVQGPDDLDKLHGDGYSFDATSMIVTNLKNLGMRQPHKVTYKRACQEGWAPAPTNDYQKAIWEQVKAEANAKPSNPIRIVKPQK